MTVYETFAFVAALTREEGTSVEQEHARLMEVINVRSTSTELPTHTSLQLLGLSGCSQVPIGNIFKKGISGGQKRLLRLGHCRRIHVLQPRVSRH